MVAAGGARPSPDRTRPNATSAPAAPAQRKEAAPTYSTTNNQEAGVDEPDLVKTDGDTLFTVAGDTLYAVSVRGEPKIVGSLKLGRPAASCCCAGTGWSRSERAARSRPSRSPAAARRGSPIPYGYGKTVLTEIDVSDPAAMKVARKLTFDGSFAAARQNGGTVAGGPELDAAGVHAEPARARAGARLAAAVALRLQRHRPQAHARVRRRATASAARRRSPGSGCSRSSR